MFQFSNDVPLSANKSRSEGKIEENDGKTEKDSDYQMLRRITMPRPSLRKFLCPVKSMSIT